MIRIQAIVNMVEDSMLRRVRENVVRRLFVYFKID
jgi:hypothetical protein